MSTKLIDKIGRYLIRLVISSFAVAITAWLLSGVHIGEPIYLNALMVAFVLSLLNSFIKPILVFFSIPVTIFSFGFFLLVINAGIILLASNIVDGFKVDGFWWALAFSIILSFVTAILDAIGNTKVRRIDHTENYTRTDKENDDLNNQEF
jgi:putative membrane protein